MTQAVNEGTQLLAGDQNKSQDGAKETTNQDQQDLVALFQTMTQAEMAEYRELVADKALICAVKTI